HLPRSFVLFSFWIRPPPGSTLCPYTTLFRSVLDESSIDSLLVGLALVGDFLLLQFHKSAQFVLPIHTIPPEHGVRTTGFPSASKDRKSTRLNSSHVKISYAVFCLKKKTTSAT